MIYYHIYAETLIGPEVTEHSFYLTCETTGINERGAATLLREIHPGVWVRAIRLTRVDDDGVPAPEPPPRRYLNVSHVRRKPTAMPARPDKNQITFQF